MARPKEDAGFQGFTHRAEAAPPPCCNDRTGAGGILEKTVAKWMSFGL